MTLQTTAHAAFLACAVACTSVAAQPDIAAYPARPLRLIVPYPAGGNPDAVARSIAGQVERQFGKTVIVDNRSGASGIIGIDLAAKSAPDGYTMLFATSSIVIIEALRDKLPYDFGRDLLPVTAVCLGAGFILAAHAALPAQNLTEFIALARNRERPVTYGSSGMANVSHLMGEMFNLHAKTHLLHVPYKGSGPALSALLGNEIQAMFVTPTIGLAPIKAGRLRALGFTGAKRWQHLPDVPAIAESVPSFHLDAGWMGWFLPAKTPTAIGSRIHGAVVRGLQDARTREFIITGGYEPAGNSPAEFRQFIDAEIKRFKELARTIKIKME